MGEPLRSRLRVFASDQSYLAFFRRSAHRRFIASDRRRRPSGVKPPRRRFLPGPDWAGRPRFFPVLRVSTPTNASIARMSLSRSFLKSDKIF